MEYKFEKNKMDLHVLREFCEREGEAVEYRKGDQLQRCPGIVEHLDLQDIASFLRPVGSKRQSRAPERHSQDHQHDPKGYHFRQGLATDFTKQQ
ncbi:MAG: hypothetical protein J5900_04095 [Prevotella sp.]|nr:hypothetical protein [Prevotella sp.]